MASTSILKLVDAENIAANATREGSLGPRSKGFFAHLKVENYVAGTYNVTIQHSPDGINDWTTVGTFAAISANGTELVTIAGALLGRVRANIAVAGGDADITVNLHFDEDK